MKSPLFLAQRLIELFPAVSHLLRSKARKSVKGRMTFTQFRILGQIQRGLDTIGVLAETNDVAQPTMSKFVDGLVRRGLVKRVRSQKDRRLIHLSHTSKGAKLSESGLQAIKMALGADFTHLSNDEREHLARVFDDFQRLLAKAAKTDLV